MDSDKLWDRPEVIAGDQPGSPQFWIADGGHYIATFNDAAAAERACRAVNAHDEAVALLKELYDWTLYKGTPWAKRAKAILIQVGQFPPDSGPTAGSQGGNLVQAVGPPPTLSGRDYRAEERPAIQDVTPPGGLYSPEVQAEIAAARARHMGLPTD